MDKINRNMEEQLQARTAALHAADDETGDGKVDWADMKKQLDRIEAQLELQDMQNRRLLYNQKLRLVLTCVLALLLAVAVGFLWLRTNQAYQEILTACRQVNELAATVQDSVDALDPDELAAMMESLPQITEQLKSIDAEALNEVLARLPDLMDNVAAIQQQIDAINSWFSKFSSTSLGALLGG